MRSPPANSTADATTLAAGSNQPSPWRKLFKWRRTHRTPSATATATLTRSDRECAAAEEEQAEQPPSSSSINSSAAVGAAATGAIQSQRSSPSKRRASGRSITSMNSTVFGFGFLDIEPEAEGDEGPTDGSSSLQRSSSSSNITSCNYSNPSSPLPPSSPTGFGFADAQLARVSEAIATPRSSHHKMFERTASTSTIYGFVDLGGPITSSSGDAAMCSGTFEHFLGASRYPTTHKLNPLLFNKDGANGEAIFADDPDHDGNTGSTGFIFGGDDDWSSAPEYCNDSHCVPDAGWFAADLEIPEEAAVHAAGKDGVPLDAPGYDEGHFSVCIGHGRRRDSLEFCGGEGFC